MGRRRAPAGTATWGDRLTRCSRGRLIPATVAASRAAVAASGALDEVELKVLSAITARMRINSQAVHATRPWKICGEGPEMRKSTPGGYQTTPEHFNEKQWVDLAAADVRLTAKDDAVAPARPWAYAVVFRIELT